MRIYAKKAVYNLSNAERIVRIFSYSDVYTIMVLHSELVN